MASKLEIILSAKNEASGPINKVKDSLDGLAGMAKTTVVAAGVAAAGAVTGIVGAVGIGVGKAAELEQGIADIASVMGITFDEAKPLGDLITQLGIDPKLKVDAVGASEAIMQLAQSGISMTEILDGAAKSTVLLSNATGGDMATSAAVASDAMALFGINAKDMQTAVNGITGVTVASKFGIQDYQYALAAAGGVASAVGVDFGDFNTAITAIAPSFAGGSDAGTSFKTFLSRLVPQSNAAESAMRSLGIITEDGKNQFYDASGSLKSMADISGILATATSGLTEEQKNATLAVIFGSDAIRAATGLASVGSEGFTNLANSIAKVDAEGSASTRMNTFGSQMEILQGVIDGLLTQIGQAFLPVLRDLANWATDYVSKNGAQLVAWFGELASWVQAVAPKVVTFSTITLKALGEIGAWLQGQGTTFEAFNVLWTTMQRVAGNAVDALLKFIQDNLPTWVANLAKWGQAAWQWIVDAAPVVIAKLVELFNGLVAWVVSSLPGWGAALAQWATSTWQWIADTTPKVKTELDKLWSGTIKPWLDTNGGGIGTAMEGWGGRFNGLVTAIQTGWNKAWPDIQAIITRASTSITGDLERIKKSLGEIGSWFSGEAGGATQDQIQKWTQFWTTIVNVIAGAESYMIDSAANIIEAVALIGSTIKTMATGDWGNLDYLGQQLRDLEMSVAQGNIDRMNWIFGLFQGLASGGQRANGGPVNAGSRYLVGERGPELFVPKTDGTIVPNGAGTTVNNTYNVYVTGSGNAGRDVMQNVQTLQALYG